MTGMPNASSNRLSADGGSGAEGRADEADPPVRRGREWRCRGRPCRERRGGGRVHRQHGDDGGNRVDPGDPLRRNQRPESPAAELAVKHQAGPGGQGREQSDHLGVDVEQREAAVAPVSRRQPVVAGHGGGDMGQLILAQHDALGRPGGPARAQEDPSGPGPPGRAGRADRMLGVRARARSVRPLWSVRHVGRPEHGQARGQAGAVFAQSRFRPGHREHPGRLGRWSSRIKRNDHPAGAEDADQRGGVPERVRHADGHPGSGRQAGAVQAPRPGLGGAPQPGVGQRSGARRIL